MTDQIEEGLLLSEDGSDVEAPEVQEDVSYDIPDKDTKDEVDSAKAKGWVPEGVAGKPRKSARQYLRDGELIEAVIPLHKKLKEQDEIIRNLADRSKRRDAEAHAKALAELTLQRDQAVANGDVASFHHVNAELAKAVASKPVEQPEDKLTPDQRDAVSDFESRNARWYNDSDENIAMKSAAISKASEIFTQIQHGQLPKLSPKQQLNMVEDHIKRMYADKFENPNRSSPSAVSSGTVKADVKVKNSVSSLNASDKKAYEHIKASFEKKGKKYSVEDFLNDF